MKRILLCCSIISATVQAQWVQSNLNCNLGRSLYTDGTTIYAASSQGVYTTSGTGDPWFSIGPENEDITSVTSAGTKLVAGSLTGKGVFLSANGGQNWYQPAGFANKDVRTLAKGATHLFAGTWGTGVWRSSDNGETWESAGLSGLAVTELYVVDSIVFAGVPGNPSKIYYSTNNGTSWDNSSLGYPASNIRSLFYDGSTLFACDIGLWASTDRGKTWKLRYGVTLDSTGYPVVARMFRIIVRHNNLLVASVDFESVHISSDGGYTWTPFNEGIISDWTFVDMQVNGPYLWVLREFFGNAYRRPLSEVVTGVSAPPGQPERFVLEQNFPNPFNPSTTIRYSLPVRSHVTLSIFNTLGQQIATLVQGEREAGYHEATFDGANLSSGGYLCKLQAGDYVTTKRLLLIK